MFIEFMTHSQGQVGAKLAGQIGGQAVVALCLCRFAPYIAQYSSASGYWLKVQTWLD